MRKLILTLLLLTVYASPALATDVYISDQGGSHVGYCEDNVLWVHAISLNGDRNAGGKIHFFVGDVLNGDLLSIMRFDLSSIPNAAAIVSAEVVLECDEFSTGQTVTIFQTAIANDDWNEGTSDWATEVGASCWNDKEYQNVSEWAGGAGNRSAGTDYINTPLTPGVAVTSTGTKTFAFNSDGLSVIQGELVDNTLELHLLPGNWNDGEYARFHSSEAVVTGNRPYLKITYIPPSEVYISDRGGSHVGYCEDNVLFGHNFSNAWNLNYGAATTLSVGGTIFSSPSDFRVIQRYDLSMIPDDATIQAAEIVIEVTAITGGGDTVSLYMIADANNDWVEGTADNVTQVGSSCWNDHTYENVKEWAGSVGLSTAGTDYVNTKLMSDLAISTTGSKTLTFNAAGKAAIEDRLGDDDIEFLFHNLTTTINNFFGFASSEHGTTAFRPYLKITYTSESSAFKIGECATCDSSTVPDTKLAESAPHNNNGALETTGVGWVAAQRRRTIIRFPLDQGELTGATITMATFGCNVSDINNGGNTTIEIHEIAAANLGWIEGTKFNALAGAGEPDWFHFSHESPTTTWAGSGGLGAEGTDYVAAVYGSFNGTSTGGKTATLSGAAITYLNSEIGNAAEFLLFTSDPFVNGERTNISSSEATAASARPCLSLTYTPAGAPTAVLSAIIIRR